MEKDIVATPEKKNEEEQELTVSEVIRKIPDLEDYDLWETLGELRI